MSDLASWLLDQVAEDERAAQAAVARSGAEWAVAHLFNDTAVVRSLTVDEAHPRSFSGDEGDLWDTEGALGMHTETAAHVARWDPALVLAECQAKRRIIVRCQEMQLAAVPMAAHLASRTLADLALPYADRPGFHEEWRP